MKTQCSPVVSWWAMYLLASLMALGLAADAQQIRAVRTIQGGVGGGAGAEQGIGFVQHIEGSGSERGIHIVIGGPGGSIDIGAALLKTCDTNQDGAATPEEVKVDLVNWFRQADTDTNGALSEVEVAAALKQIFPVPEPPPGSPPLPEEFALHNLLAGKLMTSVDANKDAWLTFKEGIGFVGQSLSQWDSDSSGSLNASEFAAVFAQFMPEPGGPGGPGGSAGVFRQLR